MLIVTAICIFVIWIFVYIHSSVVGWGTVLQAGRSRVRVPTRSLDFFNLPIPSSRPMSLESTQPLTEMSTRNILEIWVWVRGVSHKNRPSHCNLQWSIGLPLWNNSLLILHFEWNVGLYLLGCHKSHLVPWRIDPGDDIFSWNILGGKEWPVHRADNLTTIYEPIV
jgi:hypothetical protein